MIGATLRMAAAAAAGQGILLLLMPFITRVYAPSDFGVFSVYTSLTVLEVLLCLGYERALAIPREEREGYSLLIISLALAASLTLLVFVVAAIFRGPIAESLGVVELSPLLWLLPGSLLAIVAYQALTNWAIRELDFKRLAKARVLLYACIGLAQLALGWLSLGAAGLAIGHVMGYVVAVAVLLGPVLSVSRRLDLPRPEEAMALASRFRRFPIYGATSNFLNSAGLQIPVLGMAMLYGAESAGWFGLAQRVFGAPLSVVALALGQSLKATLAEAVRNGELAIAARNLLKLAFMVQLGLSVILLLIVIVAPPLFSLVFGDDWRVSGVYLQALAPLFLAQFVVSPLHVVFDVLEQPHFHFVRELLRFALLGGVFLFARFSNLDPISTVILISGSGFLVYVLSGALVVLASRQAIARLEGRDYSR